MVVTKLMFQELIGLKPIEKDILEVNILSLYIS